MGGAGTAMTRRGAPPPAPANISKAHEEFGKMLPELDQSIQTSIGSGIIPTPAEIAAMAQLAHFLTLPGGDLLPEAIQTPQQAMAIMLSGWELGVGPMTALRRMFVVRGKAEPDAQLMLALALAKDKTLKAVPVGDATKCEVTLSRRGSTFPKITYTMEDAKRSGQARVKKVKREGKWEDLPGPWQLYPADMLRHAAIKRALRLYAPDLINNVKGMEFGAAEAMIATDEEVLDAIDIESRVIDTEATALESTVSHERADVPERTEKEEQAPAPESTEEAEVDRTDYRAVVKALLDEASETMDEESFAKIVVGLRTAYPYALNVANKQFVTQKLNREDAKTLATDTLLKLVRGEGPPAPAEEGEDAETIEGEVISADDLPFE